MDKNIKDLVYLAKELQDIKWYSKEEALCTCRMISRIAQNLEQSLEKVAATDTMFFQPE